MSISRSSCPGITSSSKETPWYVQPTVPIGVSVRTRPVGANRATSFTVVQFSCPLLSKKITSRRSCLAESSSSLHLITPLVKNIGLLTCLVSSEFQINVESTSGALAIYMLATSVSQFPSEQNSDKTITVTQGKILQGIDISYTLKDVILPKDNKVVRIGVKNEYSGDNVIKIYITEHQSNSFSLFHFIIIGIVIVIVLFALCYILIYTWRSKKEKLNLESQKCCARQKTPLLHSRREYEYLFPEVEEKNDLETHRCAVCTEQFSEDYHDCIRVSVTTGCYFHGKCGYKWFQHNDVKKNGF